MSSVKRALNTILREIYGLFVDDGIYALSILLWLAAAWLLIGYSHLTQVVVDAIFLVGGLVAILIASALSFARNTRKHRS